MLKHFFSECLRAHAQSTNTLSHGFWFKSTTKLPRGCQGSLANPSGIGHGHNRLVSALVEGRRGTTCSEIGDSVSILISALKAHGITKLCPLDVVFFSALATMYDVLTHYFLSFNWKKRNTILEKIQ
tara:strand:- start:28 stop:408 length:381 start_codon:yes stop_codon:yes gene_type:complete